MIILYVISFALGMATFLFTSKFSLALRIGIALAVFVVLCVAATIWIMSIGDKPLSGSTTVFPEQFNSKDKKGE